MCPLPSEDPSPFFPPPHPSRLSQDTDFRYPVSYIKLPLAIYITYRSVYASVLFSQIIPPSPCPTESRSLFIMSQCSHVRCMKIYKGYILLLDWPLYHHVMSFLVPYYSLVLKSISFNLSIAIPVSFYFPYT